MIETIHEMNKRLQLSDEQIKSIAQELDSGFNCYINIETGEHHSLPDQYDSHFDMDIWQDEFDKLEENFDQYFVIEKMPSRTSFQIMEAFADQLPEGRTKDRLFYALNRNKPFRHFKYEVDYDEAIRQQWFKFKAQKQEEYVREEIDNFNRSERLKNGELN